MSHAKVPVRIRYMVFREAFITATYLDGLKVIKIDGVKKTQYEHWCGKFPCFAHHLRTWGEAGTVKTITGKVFKVLDRGVQCMLVGYALNHDGNVYPMWNPSTNRVLISRDIIWLKRMYFEPKVIPAIEVQPTIDTDLKISADDEDDQDTVVETNKEKVDKNNANDNSVVEESSSSNEANQFQIGTTTRSG